MIRFCRPAATDLGRAANKPIPSQNSYTRSYSTGAARSPRRSTSQSCAATTRASFMEYNTRAATPFRARGRGFTLLGARLDAGVSAARGGARAMCSSRKGQEGTLGIEGVEWKEDLLRMFNERCPVAKLAGMTLSFGEDGEAYVDLPYNRELDQAPNNRGENVVHGGVYCVLADSAGWFASALCRPKGTWPLTVDLHTRYMKATRGRALRATGRVLYSEARRDVVEIIISDESRAVAAHCTAVFAIPPSR